MIDEKLVEVAEVELARVLKDYDYCMPIDGMARVLLAYESAKQKGEAEGWRDIATSCPTILKAAQKLATDRVPGKVVIGCYGDVPAVEFKRLAALLSAGGEG